MVYLIWVLELIRLSDITLNMAISIDIENIIQLCIKKMKNHVKQQNLLKKVLVKLIWKKVLTYREKNYELINTRTNNNDICVTEETKQAAKNTRMDQIKTKELTEKLDKAYVMKYFLQKAVQGSNDLQTTRDILAKYCNNEVNPAFPRCHYFVHRLPKRALN